MTTRCEWGDSSDIYRKYHDEEWGVPVHDDQKMFEFLVLESAQAGLSWITILKRREGYRKAFAGFDPEKVALFNETKVEELMQDTGIIRNRKKIESAITNARAFLKVQSEFGSFCNYIWSFTGGNPIVNHWEAVGNAGTDRIVGCHFERYEKERVQFPGTCGNLFTLAGHRYCERPSNVLFQVRGAFTVNQ